MVEINKQITIDSNEFIFKFTRSSGPGGQNVNKVNTRVTLFFDLANSAKFTDSQKKRILTKLKTRVDKNGVIRVISQKHRTQKANRNAAIEKLAELIRAALKRKPPRRKTKVPLRAVEKRLSDKKKRSQTKLLRSKKEYLD